jgi:uncharacterized protein YozE (UPF0346 family)
MAPEEDICGFLTRRAFENSRFPKSVNDYELGTCHSEFRQFELDYF